jgi:hypothetical protein
MFGGLLKSTSLAALVAVAGVAITGISAQAADLGGNCCADLEERIAELEATTARKGNRKVSLTVSGWVNQQVMFWDDGVESNIYNATSETARSRFRFVGTAKVDANVTAGYLMEIGVRGNRQDQLSQGNDNAGAGLDVRHSAWWIQHKDLGKIWVGQTSDAADGITEITVTNISSSNFMSSELTNYIGAFNLRNSTGVLSGVTFANVAGNGFANPGEGTRYGVVKYETPTIAGFIGSASWGEDDIWAVALRYAGEFSGFKLAAGIAYLSTTDGTSSNPTGALNAERGCARVSNSGGSDVSCDEIGLSASIIHVPTGLFVTGAYGQKTDDNRRLVVGLANARDKDEFYHINAGIEQKFNALGKTTIYGEYFSGDYGTVTTNAGAGLNSTLRSAATLGLGGNIASTNIDMFGFGVNQFIDAAAMDLYVAYRNYGIDVTSTTGGKSQIEDIQTIVTGARIQF